MSSHSMRVSTRGGSLCSTSCFRRRSKYGARTLCNASTCPAPLTAPNLDSKSSLSANRRPSTKFSNDQSSAVSFCNGVPVRSTTRPAKSSEFKSRTARPSLFFNRCASSTTRQLHGTFDNVDRSACTISYVVSTMSALYTTSPSMSVWSYISSCRRIIARALGFPTYGTTCAPGAHRAASRSQLTSVDSGTTTSAGPLGLIVGSGVIASERST
mmetsp:Transcript_8804/g.32948  ORF Transcript_8804/g.32948 Transcript_8804/m.32948 type:complete len:213 (-) Transcript_8804:1212-1850(-)